MIRLWRLYFSFHYNAEQIEWLWKQHFTNNKSSHWYLTHKYMKSLWFLMPVGFVTAAILTLLPTYSMSSNVLSFQNRFYFYFCFSVFFFGMRLLVCVFDSPKKSDTKTKQKKDVCYLQWT